MYLHHPSSSPLRNIRYDFALFDHFFRFIVPLADRLVLLSLSRPFALSSFRPFGICSSQSLFRTLSTVLPSSFVMTFLLCSVSRSHSSSRSEPSLHLVPPLPLSSLSHGHWRGLTYPFHLYGSHPRRPGVTRPSRRAVARATTRERGEDDGGVGECVLRGGLDCCG